MGGSEFDYNFGSKRHWRRTVWNAIGERVRVPRNQAVVLYLAGADDLDRDVALAKGFAAHNLIAIDKDAEVVARLREKRSLSVQGEFFDVLDEFPWKRDVHVVLADLCCGFQDSVFGAVWRAMILPPFWNAVFVVNMQRGREKDQFLWKEAAQFYREAYGMERVRAEEIGKHRGDALYTSLGLAWIRNVVERAHPEWVTVTKGNDGADYVKYAEGVFERYALAFSRFTDGQKWSYRSTSGLVFDSILFINPTGSARRDELERFRSEQALYRAENPKALERRRKRIRGSMAAVLACRTMRMNEGRE